MAREAARRFRRPRAQIAGLSRVDWRQAPMSLAEQLAQLRPLMTPAEIEALLGPEEKKRALDRLSNYQRTTGVSVNFSHADEVIDSISYFADFTRDVAVCGVCIGMT